MLHDGLHELPEEAFVEIAARARKPFLRFAAAYDSVNFRKHVVKALLDLNIDSNHCYDNDEGNEKQRSANELRFEGKTS